MGSISGTLTKAILTLFEPVIKEIVNIAFAQGIDFSWILTELGFTYIKFDATYLQPFEDYFIFKLTPEFNLTSVQASM